MNERWSIEVRHEEHVWTIVREYLSTHDIAYVEALPGLVDQVLHAHKPYPMSSDGHPTPVGHKAIADVVYAGLARGSTIK